MPDFLPSTARLPGSYGVRVSLWSFYLSESALSPESWWSHRHDTLFVRGFLELCSIIEATVLFENVYTDLGWDLTPLTHSSLAKQLHAAGVLKADSLVAAAHDGKVRPSTKDSLTRLQGRLLTAAEADALARKGQSLTAALEQDLITEISTLFSGLTYKPLVLRQMTTPIELVPASVESELLRLYARTMQRLRDTHAAGVMRGYPHRMFIPPVAAMVLASAGHPANIPNALLEYRDRLQPLRRHLAELQSAVSSDDASLADIDNVGRAIQQLARQLTPDEASTEVTRVAFLRNLGSFLIKSIARAGVDFESLFKLLSTDAAQWVANRYETRSAVVLLDIVRKYRSMKAYGTLIERVFRHEMQPHEIQALEHTMRLRRSRIDVDLENVTEGWAFFQLK